jgi:acyl carrier protein
MLGAMPSGGVLVNGYGPTENTTFTTCFRMSEIDEVGERVSIGQPISNTTVYILDRELQPVPVGVGGELYTGGDGVARGYLNQPELTGERFIINPFSDEVGAKLYKTGDLARYLPDGNIEFLGRIDNQVKVRGYRIELGEIEAVLGQYDGIENVVVVAREGGRGDKTLVAYVIGEAAMSMGEVRAYVRAKLPEYMVPTHFVQVEAFPLTPNGKVDRGALPALDGSRSVGNAYEAPRTPLEMTIAEVWQEILRLEQVGIHDNFFELGGHSLLATKLIARLAASFQMELPIILFFQEPTISNLAEKISQSRVDHTDVNEMDRLLTELENLSEEEVQKFLKGV